MQALHSPTKKRMVAIAAAALAVALAAAILAAAAGSSPATQSAKTVTVSIRNFAFHPGTVTIGRGTKVVFANRDSVRHTATRRGSFSTGRIPAGQSAAVRFSSSGVYRYGCTIHPEMRGKIVIP